MTGRQKTMYEDAVGCRNIMVVGSTSAADTTLANTILTGTAQAVLRNRFVVQKSHRTL
jgi:Flp pilus assembly CpaF family ATPase